MFDLGISKKKMFDLGISKKKFDLGISSHATAHEVTELLVPTRIVLLVDLCVDIA